MAKTLQQILHYENLLGVIQTKTGGVPQGLIPAEFFNTGRRSIIGVTGEAKRYASTRQVSRVIPYGSKATETDKLPLDALPIRLLHSFESMNHDPRVLVQLTQYDNMAVQQLGQQEVDRQSMEFARRFGNLRTASLLCMLALGKLYFDAAGNLLASSGGSAWNVDYAIPAGNTGQLDVEGSGAIIGAGWDNAATDILGQINNLADAAARLTGQGISYAFYGKNLLKYLTTNNTTKEYFPRSMLLSQQVMAGRIPQGVANLNWVPASGWFFEDASGVNRPIVGDDEVIFTPAPSSEWIEWVEGTYPVPTTIDLATSIDAAAASVRPVAGFFTYAQVSHNPVTVQQFAGDTFLPWLRNPAVVFQADVTP